MCECGGCLVECLCGDQCCEYCGCRTEAADDIARMTDVELEAFAREVAAENKRLKVSDACQSVTLWRCQACGKWSHAQRKPKHHQRPVMDEPEDDSTVIRYEAGYSDPHYGDSADVWWVKCGPFAAWIAQRAA